MPSMLLGWKSGFSSILSSSHCASLIRSNIRLMRYFLSETWFGVVPGFDVDGLASTEPRRFLINSPSLLIAHSLPDPPLLGIERQMLFTEFQTPILRTTLSLAADHFSMLISILIHANLMELVSKVSPTNGNLNEDEFILSASSSDTHGGAINLFPIDFPNSFPLYDGRSTVTNLKYAINCMISSIL